VKVNHLVLILLLPLLYACNAKTWGTLNEASIVSSSGNTPDAAHSSLSVTKYVFANDFDLGTISITLKDSHDVPIIGTIPTLTSTGMNTINTCSATDSNGESTCTIKSSEMGSKSISFVSPSLPTLTDTISFLDANAFTLRIDSGLTSPPLLSDQDMKINLMGGLTYHFYVDWGDGSQSIIASDSDPDALHTYASGGEYTIRMVEISAGGMPALTFEELGYKILDVSQWGSNSWQDLSNMFRGASNFNISATDTPKIAVGAKMDGMFSYATSFNSPIGNWDIQHVTSLNYTFYHASNFNQPLNTWNTRSVETMIGTFANASSFNQDLSNWETASVTQMKSMFLNARAFNNGGVTTLNWVTDQVTDMAYMFSGAYAFNADISSWNTISNSTMSWMFHNARAFDQNIGTWNTEYVTDMSHTFHGATIFNRNINTWNTALVTNMESMFHGASSFNFPLNWDVSKVQNMNHMFYKASSFNKNLSSWDTSLVTNMSSMFHGAIAFNGIISSFNTANVTRMDRMFKDARNFNQDISAWNTSKVTNMERMFEKAEAFNQNINSNTLTLSWDIQNVTNMWNMFHKASAFNSQLHHWDTRMVTSMRGMFHGASNFNGRLMNWNTALVNDFSYMFYNTPQFANGINFPLSWNTSSATDMSFMFNQAPLFNGDLSSFQTSNVTDMSGMFQGANAFTQNLIGWPVPMTRYFENFSDNPAWVQRPNFGGQLFPTQKRLFLTLVTYNGNLGGTAGADDKCATDLNNPGGVFKALLGNNDRSLHPISMDWVTAPHVEYYEPLSTYIVTKTNYRGIFNLILSSFEAAPSGVEFWTGLDENTWAVSNNNCGNWESGESTSLGDASEPNDWSITADTCDQMKKILCVEI
jgi:surface protein